MIRLFRLALIAAAASYALIVLSGVSRITDSRLDAPWVVETLHRVGALITVATVLAVAIGATLVAGVSRRTQTTSWVAVGLVAIQIGLGAIAEGRDFPAGVATASLAAALLCAAATMLTAYFVALDRGGPLWLTQAGALRVSGPDHRDRGFLGIAQLAAAVVLVLILSGAATSSSGATLACTAWPLCQEGRVLPNGADSDTWLNLSHRGVALIGMVTVGLIAVAAVRRGASPFVQGLAFAACAVILLQSLVGALYVTTDLDSPWLGGVHLGLAALLWAMTVSIVIVARRAFEAGRREGGETGRITAGGRDARKLAWIWNGAIPRLSVSRFVGLDAPADRSPASDLSVSGSGAAALFPLCPIRLSSSSRWRTCAAGGRRSPATSP